MKLQHDDMDELIGKVLAGEATEQEQLQLNTWLAANPANQTYFDNLKIILIKRPATMLK
jgi:transmembrane sensor